VTLAGRQQPFYVIDDAALAQQPLQGLRTEARYIVVSHRQHNGIERSLWQLVRRRQFVFVLDRRWVGDGIEDLNLSCEAIQLPHQIRHLGVARVRAVLLEREAHN